MRSSVPAGSAAALPERQRLRRRRSPRPRRRRRRPSPRRRPASASSPSVTSRRRGGLVVARRAGSRPAARGGPSARPGRSPARACPAGPGSPAPSSGCRPRDLELSAPRAISYSGNRGLGGGSLADRAALLAPRPAMAVRRLEMDAPTSKAPSSIAVAVAVGAHVLDQARAARPPRRGGTATRSPARIRSGFSRNASLRCGHVVDRDRAPDELVARRPTRPGRSPSTAHRRRRRPRPSRSGSGCTSARRRRAGHRAGT